LMTFQRRVLPQRALAAIPWIRIHPMVVSCLTGNYLPIRLLKHARAVVVLSERTKRLLAGRGLTNVCHIPPGVDLDYFTPQGRAEYQGELGVGEGPFLLFAGHHDPGGGLDAALRVTASLRKAHPSLRLLLAMRSRPGQDRWALKKSLHTEARRLGLEGGIVELGPTANILAAMGGSFAVLFQAETLNWKMVLPLILIEALAMGRPIVVSKAGALPELADGSPAALVSDAGGQDTVGFLQRLIDDPPFLEECSGAARRLAEVRYDIRHMTGRYQDLYRRVLYGNHSAGTSLYACPEAE
jgi:glycosyltransferase involved in cell wall biosynthesis